MHRRPDRARTRTVGAVRVSGSPPRFAGRGARWAAAPLVTVLVVALAVVVHVARATPAAADGCLGNTPPTDPWSDEHNMVWWCGGGSLGAPYRNFVADPGIGHYLDRTSGSGAEGLLTPARAALYHGLGFDDGFLWYAPERTVTVPKADGATQWTACAANTIRVDPGGQCDPSHLKFGPVSGDFDGDVTLRVIGEADAWIALGCGNTLYGHAPRTYTPRIRVEKYEDLDRDGARSPGEGPLAGVEFRIDRVSSLVGQAPAADLARGTTTADGSLTLAVPGGPGTYAVEEMPRDGWTLTPGQLARRLVDVGFGVGDATVATEAFGNAPAIDVSVGAEGRFTRAWDWDVAKSADPALVKQVGGTVPFRYAVTLSHGVGVDRDWFTAGTVTVVNHDGVDHGPLAVAVASAEPDDSCALDPGQQTTVPAHGTIEVRYRCSLPAAPVDPAHQHHDVTVTSPPVFGRDPTTRTAASDFAFPAGPTTRVDDCVDLADSLDGGPALTWRRCVVDADAAETFVDAYTRTIAPPARDCADHRNEVVATASSTAARDRAEATVRLCGPDASGARTIGFWQNRNGQAVILGGASAGGVCRSGTYLRSLAPFADLPATATCAQVAAYVAKVLSSANAAGSSMNPMLKAQALATALDVHFSDPGLGGNPLAARAPIGSVPIDLTKVCADPGGCTAYADLSSMFGAPSASVSAILAAVASASSPGGSVWYGNDKSAQERAKTVLDGINNQVVFR